MTDIKAATPAGFAPAHSFTRLEVQRANRNRGMLIEGLRYPVTPTGMHYLLIHDNIPEVDVRGWRLEIGGLVARPLRLALDDIRSLPRQTAPITMECAGNGRALLDPRPKITPPWHLEAVSTAEWTGARLDDVLAQAGVLPEAVEIVFTGLDRGARGGQINTYERSLAVAEAARPGILLAYEMNGESLPPQHGAPLRLMVPGWYGMASVKWLARLEAVAQPFRGHHMLAYRYAQSPDDPGTPVTWMKVRALMIPPGLLDVVTGERLVEAGPIRLQGRAWAGGAVVARVEVSADGGTRWADAELEDGPRPSLWRGWAYSWEARPGKTTLCVRATDSNGNTQPMEQSWTYRGHGNNMVQRVDVTVA
jgi:DMSO/TMAO reductase YedYZ molybdopterin-dependent catalytic subunit